jgi:hypothetical protein
VKGNDALCQLDIGNQVAARCVKYVSEILSLLDRWRKSGYGHARMTSTQYSFSDLTNLLGSSSTIREDTFGDFTLSQDLFQSAEARLAPSQALNLDTSQMTPDNLYMSNFSLDDFEMGQFYIPDDLLRWGHSMKNKEAQ